MCVGGEVMHVLFITQKMVNGGQGGCSAHTVVFPFLATKQQTH